VDATPCHIPYPLNISLDTNAFSKFKYHPPNFSRNVVNSGNEHLATFSNVHNNIGSHENGTYMRLFVNDLE